MPGSEQVQFQLKAGSDRFHASSLTGFTSFGDQASWTAIGEWNGVAGYRLTASVVDVGPPHGGLRDSIRIVIEAPDGSVVFTTSGPLLGGNIVIH